jgi:phage terminase small subunit
MAARRQVLNAKQTLFVQGVIEGKSGTEAAELAGFGPKNPGGSAAALMRRPNIAAAIAVGRDRLARKHEITADRLLSQLAIVAFGDVRALFDAGGRLKGIHELDENVARLLDIEASYGGEGGNVVKMKAGASIQMQAIKEIRSILGIGAKDGPPIAGQTNIQAIVNVYPAGSPPPP